MAVKMETDRMPHHQWLFIILHENVPKFIQPDVCQRFVVLIAQYYWHKIRDVEHAKEDKSNLLKMLESGPG